jgi:hypothetical protein
VWVIRNTVAAARNAARRAPRDPVVSSGRSILSWPPLP